MAAAVLGGLGFGQWASNIQNISFIVPSGRDFLLAGPRIVYRLLSLPSNAVEHIFGANVGRFIIANATALTATSSSSGTSKVNATQAVEALRSATHGLSTTGLGSKISMESARNLSGVISYTTSKWALSSLLMSILINRTYVYASTRRPLSLSWQVRLLVRLLPVAMLVFYCRNLLQAIQCQTSSHYVLSHQDEADASRDHPVLHTLSSILLLRPADIETCRSINMLLPGSSPNSIGSLSLLWPLYKTLCLSQIVETLICAVEGRRLFAETCMSLFEHSLAFAEAETAVGVSSVLASITGSLSDAGEASKNALSRSMRLKQLNTTPEVLSLALISAMNHVSSHVLAVFNLQNRYRFLHTGFWGVWIMAILVHSAWQFSVEPLANHSLLRYPTVYLVGFAPHMIVIAGICACAAVYIAAVSLAVLTSIRFESPVGQSQAGNLSNVQLSIKQKILMAHQNMQANMSLSSVRISMQHDFFTALLKVGFTLVSIAADAVYLCQSDDVRVKPRTWLEDEFSTKLQLSQIDQAGSIPTSQSSEALQRSPYNKQTQVMNLSKAKKANKKALGDAPSRWIVVVEFQLQVCQVLLRWSATIALKLLLVLGIQTRPRFLTSLLSRQGSDSRDTFRDTDHAKAGKRKAFEIKGVSFSAEEETSDPEIEMMKYIGRGRLNCMDEDDIDAGLYKYWLGGGSFSENDRSGDYIASNDDEDTTSVISETTSDECGVRETGDNEGSRTPILQTPRFSRGLSPLSDTPLTSSNLARLLSPKSSEDRDEARLLAAHLTHADKVITRSRYRQYAQMEDARVLLPPNLMAASFARLEPDEEARILEHLIISKRELCGSFVSTTQDRSWSKGASGLGEGGPQCVVCQSSPRVIIVFPCKCLSLCDECRVSLAMNNFDKCVCCRKEVTNFSRIFVP